MRDTEEGKSRITHFEKIFGFKNISSNLQFTSDSQWTRPISLILQISSCELFQINLKYQNTSQYIHQFYSLQWIKLNKSWQNKLIGINLQIGPPTNQFGAPHHGNFYGPLHLLLYGGNMYGAPPPVQFGGNFYGNAPPQQFQYAPQQYPVQPHFNNFRFFNWRTDQKDSVN